MKLNQKENIRKSGFTLVEVLLAILIFSMAIMAVMVVLSGGLTSIENVKKKMTAEYLAQEGVEFVRNIRDTNIITSIKTAPDYSGQGGWDAFKNTLTSRGCMSTSNPTPTSGCSIVLLEDSNFYLENQNISNNFVRRITARTIDPNEIQITAMVSWGSSSKAIYFSEVLYNWTN